MCVCVCVCLCHNSLCVCVCESVGQVLFKSTIGLGQIQRPIFPLKFQVEIFKMESDAKIEKLPPQWIHI